MAVCLAERGGCVEDAILVLPLATVRVEVVAWPLDGALAEPVVTHARVVARTPAAARLPRIEGTRGVGPLDQRRAVLVAEIHPRGVVEQDVQVGPRLAGRVDDLVGE